MIKETDQYYLTKEEPNQGCLLALRQIIFDQDKNISEALKWKLPCFMYKNKMFCFLSIDKKTNKPYLLMVEGNRLSHPQLEQGNRSRMKVLNINPNQDLPINDIQLILDEALDLYRNGLIKTK